MKRRGSAVSVTAIAFGLVACGDSGSKVGGDGGVDPLLCGYFASASDSPDPNGPVVGFVEGSTGIGIVPGVDPKTRLTSYLDWMGSGVCVFDYDGDGAPDLLFTSRAGSPPCGATPSRTRLYHNDLNRHFSDVTAAAGLDDGHPGVGCAVGDIDNDGDLDLFISDDRNSNLYENRGGVFANITAASGVFNSMHAWQTSAVFVDADSDGSLDLYVSQFDHDGMSGGDLLFHNQGHNIFSDVSVAAGIHGASHTTLNALFFDFDRDGKIDFYVGNDTGKSQLYMNQGRGVFKDEATMHGVQNDIDQGARAASMMGLAAADLDGDDKVELLSSDDAGFPNIIYKCDDQLVCRRQPPAGLGMTSSVPTFKWGIGALDVDDDGKLDVMTANGYLLTPDISSDLSAGFLLTAAPFSERPQLYLNKGNLQFSEFIPGKGDALRKQLSARGLVYADLDDDGDLDVVLSTYGQRPVILYNQLSAPDGKSWAASPAGTVPRPLNVHLRGSRSSPDPIGAIVTVHVGDKVYTQVHTGGGYFLSGVEPFVHFGLGSSAHIDSINVRWPAGGMSALTRIPDDATKITITE